MRILLYLLLVFCLNPLFAQEHPTCDGLRYRTTTFNDVEITRDIQFGSGTTIAGNQQDLFLDVYEPAGDNASSRPAIILAFGGSFVAGSRQDMSWLCEAYAEMGYVAVTIDYRLYDLPLFPLPTEDELTNVVVKAISDMKAAVRFFREDAATNNQFRVDPELIFVGGISAGAITAAHTASLDSTDAIAPELIDVIESNGGFSGNSSDNLQYSDEVAGFINFSGALSDALFINSEDPPFYSVHEEFDQTVPYGKGFANVFGFDLIYLEGSQTMHEVADSVGVLNLFDPILGSMEHVGYFFGLNPQPATYVNASANFVHDLFCEAVSTNLTEVELEGVSVYPNPSQGWLYINNEQGLDLEIYLYNTLGQQLGVWYNEQEVDISRYNAGSYFLKIRESNSSKLKVERIVLQP